MMLTRCMTATARDTRLLHLNNELANILVLVRRLLRSVHDLSEGEQSSFARFPVFGPGVSGV